MTRRWTSRDVTDLSVKVAELVPEALQRAQKDCHGGFRSGHGDGRGTRNGSGAPSSPAEMLAISGRLDGDRVPEAVKQMVDGLLQAHQAASYLLAVELEDAQKMVQKPEAGDYCCNCGRWVAGTVSDRLKSGRCETCYKWRIRHDGADRSPGGDNETAGQPVRMPPM